MLAQQFNIRTRSRTLVVNVKAFGPFDRHREKMRELMKEIHTRKEKAEKVNTDFLLKNQIILKQILNDEIEYIKNMCKTDTVVEPEVMNEDKETIITDSFDEITKNEI